MKTRVEIPAGSMRIGCSYRGRNTEDRRPYMNVYAADHLDASMGQHSSSLDVHLTSTWSQTSTAGHLS